MVVLPLAALSPVDRDAGAAELECAYGGPAPLSIATRLCRDGDGRWLLSFRHFGGVALHDLPKGDTFDRAVHGVHANSTVAGWIRTDFGPIDVVLAKLRDGVESDVDRFEKIERQKAEFLKADLARAAREQAERDANESARQARALEFKRSEWNALPELSQYLYSAAMAVDAGSSPAATLRALAEDVAKGGRRVFPDKRWWD